MDRLNYLWLSDINYNSRNSQRRIRERSPMHGAANLFVLKKLLKRVSIWYILESGWVRLCVIYFLLAFVAEWFQDDSSCWPIRKAYPWRKREHSKLPYDNEKIILTWKKYYGSGGRYPEWRKKIYTGKQYECIQKNGFEGTISRYHTDIEFNWC